MDIKETIQENKRRLAEILADYDPVTGKGSLEDRIEVEFSDLDRPLYLPVDMLCEPWVGELVKVGSFSEFAETISRPVEEVHEMFMRERFKFDFEYWAVILIMIQDKLTLEPTPFKLRLAQRLVLRELERMRRAGRPIRFVLLKARQWGGSTLIQFYMMWIQQIHKKNWHSAICAQDDGAAKNIGDMYQRACNLYPKEVGTITFMPYAKSPKNIVNIERGGIIGVGSINNPDQFRSYNYPMIHISEPGVWQDTPKRTAQRLVQSLRRTVPKAPFTLVAVESTAKGVGSFFHREWLSAMAKKSGYVAIFVPWFMIDLYLEPIANGDYADFIEGLNEYDRFMWSKGATLEGIKWYNKFKADENCTEEEMFEEMPTTPEEAFISTGNRVFPYKYIANARTTIQKPTIIGDIYPQGIASKESLTNIEFHDNTNGNLMVWKMPQPFLEINGKKYTVANRYCGFADIGGINRRADYSCIKILDRVWKLWGGVPETAAMWHGHLDQDLFAWKCAQLGRWYQGMLLAIEANSLKKEKTDGDYFVTVLNNIAPFYDNLFIRNNEEATNRDYVPKYGFQTGHGNKDMIITTLLGCFRGDINGRPLYNERDAETLDECDWYERKPDGSLGAVEGKKDDKVIITAGSVWLSERYMPAPYLVPYIDPKDKRKKVTKTIVSEASL